MKRFVLGLAIAFLAAPFAPRAFADESLRVGKADRAATPIIPVNVGVKKGFFAKHGVEVQISDFSGGAKLHQAMEAGAIDIGVGAGPEMAFIAKGAQAIAICNAFPSVRFIGISVPPDSPLKSIDELKGKKMGVSSTGSLTYWLALQLARKKNWENGIETVAIGNASAGIIAAFRTHAVDADITATSVLFDMEANNVGRFLAPVSDYAGRLSGGTIYAATKLVEQKPDAIRRFLAGWFDTIDFMQKNKAEAVAIMAEATGFSPAVEGKEYDLTVGDFSHDGKFDAESLANLKQSFTDLKLVDSPPDMSKLYTEAFLPKR